MRAAHWDDRNELAEKVASGLYFYTFTAGDFTAKRKMLIMNIPKYSNIVSKHVEIVGMDE